MKTGKPTIERRNARNYTYDQAQKRLQEAIKPYQQQGLNALRVDAHELLVFLKQPSNKVCTCREQVVQDDDASPLVNSTGSLAGDMEIRIDFGEPLFGEANIRSHEDDLAASEEDLYGFNEDTQESVLEAAIDAHPDCGICYKTGFVPGLVLQRHVREVFVVSDHEDQSGYNLQLNTAPIVAQPLFGGAWMEFRVTIPKYFKEVICSIRNNYELLDTTLFTTSGTPITKQYLKDNAGKEILVRVVDAFTHFTLTFDLGSEPIYGNIAQFSKATDWTTFETLSNVNIILPMTLPELTPGSIILAPNINQGMRITDVQYMRTATNDALEWSCGTRILQPQEQFKRIFKGSKIR